MAKPSNEGKMNGDAVENQNAIIKEASLIDADASYSMMTLRNKYELALQARIVAHIIRHYCRDGQDISCETLKKIYYNLTRLIQGEESTNE